MILTDTPRQVGDSGLVVSPLILGTADFGSPLLHDDPELLLGAAIDAGITTVDTSDNYRDGEGERLVGAALRRLGRRDEIIITTKCGFPGGAGVLTRNASRLHIIRSCEASLRRLQVDHIDLLLLHRPSFDVGVAETIAALHDLVTAGKIRYFGTSHFPAWKVMEGVAYSDRHGLPRFIADQPGYNILDRRIEAELIPLCQRYGVGVITCSPLGGGILSGDYNSGTIPEGSRADLWRDLPFRGRVTPAAISVAGRVAQIAADHGYTASQLGVLWVISQPGITATIIAPATRAQLAENVAVMGAQLPAAAAPAIDALNPPAQVISDFFSVSGWTHGEQVIRSSW